VVEEAAMAQALKNDQLAGLALDVYTKEPPPEDDSDIQAIIKDPRVLCTPHLGASSKEAKKRVSLMAADQISDFFKSGKIENSVLKDA
jgi:D-3-phosphoglycerate dehydrogenase